MIIFKILWAFASLLILLATLYAFDGSKNSDVGIFFAWSMIFITFPGGLVVPLMHVIHGILFAPMNMSYSFIFLNWVLFTCVGYVQWFVLCPRLFIAIKRRFVDHGK